jgi:hypothetical protein
MAVVNQSLKFKDLILLEEDGETHLKKKWWRKFWEMDQLMAISKHQKCLAFIKKEYSVKKDLLMFIKNLNKR